MKPDPGRWPPRALLAATLLLHLVLVLHFAPLSTMLEPEPIWAIDYSLHYYQVDRFRRAFDESGRFWSYDPQVLAGQPAGAMEDLTSKGMELFVVALSSGLGVDQAVAYNLFILLVHLLLPLAAWLTAWLLGLGRWARALLVLAWICLWFFDSFFHWIWYCGMISWSAAAYLSPLLMALVYRTVEGGRPRLWLATALLAALLITVHPFAAFAAALPCAAIYFRDARRLGVAHHLGLALTLVVVVAVQLPWLITANQFSHYLLELVSFLKPPFRAVLSDFLELLRDPWDSGAVPVRSMFRFLILAAGLAGLWRWRKTKDRRLLPVGLMGLGLLVMAYGGGLIPPLGKVQPHRQLMPAIFALALPAVLVLMDTARELRWGRLSTAARTALVLCLVLLLPRVARTVMVGVPDLIPERPRQVPGQGPKGPRLDTFTGTHGTPIGALKHRPTPPHFKKIRAWLLKNHKGHGRVLAQDWMMSEYFAWSTKLPQVGGLEQRAITHGDAHLFRKYPQGKAPNAWLRAYLERYAVGFIVVKAVLPDLERQRNLLEPQVLIENHRIYKTRIKPSYFLIGQGTVVSQRLNSIKVDRVSGPSVVLRFHWMETLRCRPSCKVERYELKGDRVGFIGVRDPPEKFEIYNSYEWE